MILSAKPEAVDQIVMGVAIFQRAANFGSNVGSMVLGPLVECPGGEC